jgi:hypothetical protein
MLPGNHSAISAKASCDIPDMLMHLDYYRRSAYSCQKENGELSGARRLSGFVAHNLFGLLWSPLEVTDEDERHVIL